MLPGGVEDGRGPAPSRRRSGAARRAPSRGRGRGRRGSRRGRRPGRPRPRTGTRRRPAQAPTKRTASVPMVGIASMAGSKRPRVRPTSMLASRSCLRDLANRSASWSSRPSDLTMSAASKLSCADLGDLGAQLLGDGDPGRHRPLEERRWPGRAAGRRSAPTSGEQRVDEHHLHDAEDEHDDHAEGHRQRREDVPRRLDVGVGVGQQLARRVLVVPRRAGGGGTAGSPDAGTSRRG